MKISNIDEIEFIKEVLKSSLLTLKARDINLIENPMGFNENEKKLHEVCINHRLAVYIEKYLEQKNLSYFVDIEYNKNNYLPKILDINNEQIEVRPDILVHTRIENNDLHKNYLIIESKKEENSLDDENKIKAFLKDRDYRYKFGCKIIYGNLHDNYDIKLYFSRDGEIIINDRILLE